MDKYNEDEVKTLLNTCTSLKEVLLQLGKKVNGGTYRSLKKYMTEKNLFFHNRNTIRDEYEKKPMFCKTCGKKLEFEQRYNTFCSKSCAAKINNQKFPKRKKEQKKEKKKRTYPSKRNYQENDLYCIFCGKKLNGNQKKFCSNKCKRDFYTKNNYQTKHSSINDKKGTLIKLEYVKKLGGKCAVCGYNKNLSALVFHHVNDKKLSLTARTFSRFDEHIINDEIKKCILLCHNCHSELHHPEHNFLIE